MPTTPLEPGLKLIAEGKGIAGALKYLPLKSNDGSFDGIGFVSDTAITSRDNQYIANYIYTNIIPTLNLPVTPYYLTVENGGAYIIQIRADGVTSDPIGDDLFSNPDAIVYSTY